MEVNHILLGLLGRALFASQYTFDLQSAPWEALFAECRAQSVELLVLDALTEEERGMIPKETLSAWQFAAFRRLSKNEMLRHEQSVILKALQEAKIPCVVLKGFTCSDNYPNPALRSAGDIDLLVGLPGVERSRTVLETMGYKEAEEAHPYHLSLTKGSVVVELHHEPVGIPAGAAGQSLRQWFLGSEEQGTVRNGIPVLPKEQEAVLLLLHKLEHIMTSGLGLRQLCDWAVFVHRQMDETAWQTLKPHLENFGLLYFAKVITRICVGTLALPQEAAPWCMDAEQAVCDALLSDMLRTGNFGIKENRYGQRLFTDANSSNRLTSFWKVGVQACKDHWPICEKYPILLPVAPIYLLRRYDRQRKEGLRPPLKLRAVYQGAQERQKLYASLKPFAAKPTEKQKNES